MAADSQRWRCSVDGLDMSVITEYDTAGRIWFSPIGPFPTGEGTRTYTMYAKYMQGDLIGLLEWIDEALAEKDAGVRIAAIEAAEPSGSLYKSVRFQLMKDGVEI